MKLLHSLLAAALLFGSAAAAAAADPSPRAFTNPYADVPWGETRDFLANLHTHTTYSDGEFAPHEVIDLYHKRGVHILALTDHDNDHYDARPAILFPWTRLASIFDEIRDAPNPCWLRQGLLYRDFTGPWEDRDPAALGMLAVPGSEISRTHHIASLFCDYPGNTTSEQTALEEIGRHGGIAVFLHPGRYNHYLAWYLHFYRRHPHLIGMEVFNQNDRCPGDRDLWDRVLHALMPDRPVWGFAGDDTHVLDHLGWNLLLLPLPELTPGAVRAALESGAFCFYRPDRQNALPSLSLASVSATPDTLRLSVQGEIREIEWITFNPKTAQSEILHRGDTLALADVPASSTFVRARIRGADGTLYTQPFGIRPPPAPPVPPVPARAGLQQRDGWTLHQAHGAHLSLEETAGPDGPLLNVSFDLPKNTWVAMLKPVGTLTPDAVIGFSVRGTGAPNSIELKIEDAGGATYGRHLPVKSNDAEWTAMEIAVRDLLYWWGGEEPMDLSRVGLSFAIVHRHEDDGGSGTLLLDRLYIR